MTYHPLLAVLLLSATASHVTAQEDSVKKIKPPTPLFASNDPIAIQISADFKSIFKDRGHHGAEVVPRVTGTWKAGSNSGTASVELTTRGHYRLKSATCGFPMLRLKFPKDSTKPNPLKGTLFEKQGTLKLSTHCRSGNSRFRADRPPGIPGLTVPSIPLRTRASASASPTPLMSIRGTPRRAR